MNTRAAFFWGILGFLTAPLASANSAIRVYAGDDTAKYEVTGFESNNSKESGVIVDHVAELLQEDLAKFPQGTFEILVNMEGSVAAPTTHDYDAYALGQRIAALDSRLQLSNENIPLDPVLEKAFRLKHWREKKYRMSFALVRGMSTTGLMTASLMITAAVPVEIALPIAVVAGSMSFLVQYHAKRFNDWTEQTGPLARLMGYKDPSQAPRAVHGTESYMRWYLAQLAFGGIIKVAMSTLGIDQDFATLHSGLVASGNLLMTSLYATAAQGTWERVITTTRHRAEMLGKQSPNEIDYRTNFKYLLAAMTSTVFLSMQLLNIPNAEIGFFAMSATGIAAYARTIQLNRRLEKRGHDLNKKAVRPSKNCQILIRQLAAY